MMVLVLFILAIYVTMVYARSPRCWWNVPDPHPLHLDVPALPHRQRLVRRLPAGHLASVRWPPPATSTRAVVPIIIAAINLVIGLLFLRETKDVDISMIHLATR
jgi:hypothetical protein